MPASHASELLDSTFSTVGGNVKFDARGIYQSILERLAGMALILDERRPKRFDCDGADRAV
jgi:hypothetical protein